MDNEMEFFVPEGNYEEIKKLIRSCKSLRFKYNPRQLNGRYQISISGSVEDFNIIDGYMALLEKPKVEKKKGLLERISSAFGLG